MLAFGSSSWVLSFTALPNVVFTYEKPVFIGKIQMQLRNKTQGLGWLPSNPLLCDWQLLVSYSIDKHLAQKET